MEAGLNVGPPGRPGPVLQTPGVVRHKTRRDCRERPALLFPLLQQGPAPVQQTAGEQDAMGCDIHVHVEVKIKDKWEHYSVLHIGRSYSLFAKMAGVRGGETPISQPRGLPQDISVVTAFDNAEWGVDGHSHSWLSAVEAGEVQRWYEEQCGELDFSRPPLFGYLFGNYIDSYVKYPEDGKHLRELGYEDARVVFWFDN